MKNTWIVLPAVAVAAVLGFVAQKKMGGDGAPAPVAATDTPTEETAGAPTDGTEMVPGATEPGLTIPDTLPGFQLADRDGKLRGLADWKGKPVMVNYWATWCAPCRREIPLLNELHAQKRAPGLEVIGIAVDFRDDVLKYAGETPIHYPLLIGEEDGLEAVKSVGMQPGFPFTIFADSQQRILTVKIGELHRDEAELILDKLAAVDKGSLPLAQAKLELDAGLKDIATRRAATKPAAEAG